MAEITKYDKLASGIATFGQISELGLGITSTIFAIKDAKQRALFQQSLETLSLQQKNELENQVQRASALNEKIRIITEAVTKIRIAEVQKKLEKGGEGNNKQLLYIIGGGVAILLVAVIIKSFSK